MAQPQQKVKLGVDEVMDQNTVLLAQDGEAQLELRKDGQLLLIDVNNLSVLATNKYHGTPGTYTITLTPGGLVEERDSTGLVVWSGGKKHAPGNPYFLSVSNIPTASVYKADGAPLTDNIFKL